MANHHTISLSLALERRSIRFWIKRFLDIVFSALLLVLLLPLLVIIAFLVKMTSKGPVLYSDYRVGQNGHLFKMYKFRTMFNNANEIKQQLLEHNEMSGPVFKIRRDPRITSLGYFLRKHSLDELPQLWSILKGDMSLVGPRPPLPEEVKQYQPWHYQRLSVKPGATCLWQVMGRNEIDNFDEWVRMDLDYIRHWSLQLDFKIILKTIWAVFRGTGC